MLWAAPGDARVPCHHVDHDVMDRHAAGPAPLPATRRDLPPCLGPTSIRQGERDRAPPRPRQEAAWRGLAALAMILACRRRADFDLLPCPGGGCRTGVRSVVCRHTRLCHRPGGRRWQRPAEDSRPPVGVLGLTACASTRTHQAMWMWSPSSMTSSGPVQPGVTRWARAVARNADREPAGTTTSTARPWRWSEPGTPPTARLRSRVRRPEVTTTPG